MAREDPFEAEAMHDGAPVVARDKLIVRKMTALFFAIGSFHLVLSLWTALANGASSKPLVGVAFLATVAFFALSGLSMFVAGIAFGVLRTVVTRKAIHVRYGLWGPTIPLENIESARVVPYDWTEFGGWGIRFGRNGARAYVPKSGPCVEAVYRDGTKAKRVLFGAEDAAGMVAAIHEARRTHVRVAIAADEALAAEEIDATGEIEETEEARRSAR